MKVGVSEPVYVLPAASTRSLGAALATLMSLQALLYTDENGEVVSKEWGTSKWLRELGEIMERGGFAPHELTVDEMSTVMHKVGRLDT